MWPVRGRGCHKTGGSQQRLQGAVSHGQPCQRAVLVAAEEAVRGAEGYERGFRGRIGHGLTLFPALEGATTIAQAHCPAVLRDATRFAEGP